MSSELVIGIDTSVNSTGVVCLDHSCAILYSGVIQNEVGGHIPVMQKLLRSEQRLNVVLDAFVKYPVLVVLEKHNFRFSRGSSKGSYDVSMFDGIVKRLLYLRHIPHLEVNPGDIKRYAGGQSRIKKASGVSKKSPIVLAVENQWNCRFIGCKGESDLTDAYIMARIGCKLLDLKFCDVQDSPEWRNDIIKGLIPYCPRPGVMHG